MPKSAILYISHGDFSQDFDVVLEIKDDDQKTMKRVEGKLPPAQDLPTLYQQWRDSYIGLETASYIGLETALRGKPLSNQAGHSQDLLKNCDSYARNFLAKFGEWLEYKEFQKLIPTLADEKPLQLILQMEEDTLKRFPWNKWDLLDDPKHPNYLANTEIALSKREYQAIPAPNMERIRILAILGNSEGIDVNADRKSLEELVTPYADIFFHPEPQRIDISDQLWKQKWTILFFSGHSSSQGGTGNILLNQKDILNIEGLKYGLENAGLQLAIFNSCDGLKLAESLANYIPQTIVMREPVPDKVAQAFLEYFLREFISGETLYLSVRKARKRLCTEGWDEKIPGCTWLPVIWQNPAAVANSPMTLEEWVISGQHFSDDSLTPFEKGEICLERKNRLAAFYFFKKSAERGDANGINSLGVLYLEDHGVLKDDKKALDLFRKAAGKGNMNSQYNIGLIYENGYGVEKSNEQAFSCYLKAAEQGHKTAQYRVGILYQQIKHNDAEAFKWYEKAANQGHQVAQYRLGKMYLNGAGTNQNTKQAVHWLEKSAKQGNAESQCCLGDVYSLGKWGLAENYKLAYDYYKKSASRNHPYASYNLGKIYKSGISPRDDDKAKEYFLKAKEQCEKHIAQGSAIIGLDKLLVSIEHELESNWYHKLKIRLLRLVREIYKKIVQRFL